MHRETLSLMGDALQMYANGSEAVAHEIAHSILLFGRVFIGCVDANSARIEEMHDYAANRHELKAIALQHASMRALGSPQALRGIVESSMGCFRGTDRQTLLSVRSIMRAVEEAPAKPRNVRLFKQVVERFAYFTHGL